MNNDNPIINGRYRHYKGGEYEVIGVGAHTETQEELVLYRTLNPPHKIWARPFDMFFETVAIDGKELPRFEKLDR